MCKRFTVIGIPDADTPALTDEVTAVISASTVFSGGERHREIMRRVLPDGAEWIDIKVPLQQVFTHYRKHRELTVFASGDPLFFGFAATLQREFPDAEIRVIPWFYSLQTLAHRMVLPYQDMVNVSVTGRPWKNLDDALIAGHSIIGVLTDRRHTPDEAARRMKEYGYTGYTMTVGEHLGNPKLERVRTMSLDEAAGMRFGTPCCFILRRISPPRTQFGIPESEFHHLDGRANMITKMPVRLVSLAMLDLPSKTSLWDVGFCTGSISIESRLRFPHLTITAFERREESRDIFYRNTVKFGTPSIESVIADFMQLDLDKYPAPDAVFIGGHGGRLAEMTSRIFSRLLPGGTVVFNSVSTDSCETFRQAVASAGHSIVEEHRITIDSHNTITIMKAR